MLINDPLSPSFPRLLKASCYFGGGSTPQVAQVNLTKELEQLLAGYQNTAGGFLDLNKAIQPGYTQLGLQNEGTTLQGYTDPVTGAHVPGTTELTNTANTATRTSNVNDLSAIGPGVTGSILAANPWLFNSANDTSSTLDALTTQANQGLALNGALAPSEARDLNESVLGYFGNAGISNGNQAIAAQLLSRDAATRARQQQAQSFAESVTQLGQGATNTFSSAFTNPLLQILGLGNLNPGYGSSSGTSPASAVSTSNSLFPLAPGFDAGTYNANAQNAANIAGANNSAASSAGWLSLFGSLISDKRVKKNIRKTGEKTPSGIPKVTYIYKTDPKKKRYVGVLAQDVEKIDPASVTTDRLSGLKAVRAISSFGDLLMPQLA